MNGINFVESRWMYLSPFSAHRVEIWGEAFPTVEHAYQAARVRAGAAREAIKNAGSPLEAWRLAQKCKQTPEQLVADFDKDAVMEDLFRAKLAQHPDIADILRESGNEELLKVYATDYYWGTGADGSGQNKMGVLWMKLRAELAA